MSEPLDPEVALALDRAGLRVRDLTRISTLRSPDSGRSAYRIALESGRTIKARRLEDEETACRLFELTRHLPDAFAPAFDRHGAVLLEEWIEGEGLADRLPTGECIVEAGSLLAHVHATETVAGRSVREVRSIVPWREDAHRYLLEIVAAGGLDASDVPFVRDRLDRLDPGQAMFGLVHNDFCGENMVIDRAGRLRVIDNDRVAIGVLALDVARTWYRWALPAELWKRFEAAYTATMPFTQPLEPLGFWSIVAVLKSAALRLRLDSSRVHVPLDRLRRMARELRDKAASSREDR